MSIRHRLGATTGAERIRDLGEWLNALPKPVAVLTWAMDRGFEILEACEQRGLDIPEDVAILAGDDDELLCETVSPPLSGVIVPSERIGLEAASMLQRLMDQQPLDEHTRRLSPLGISTRQSTDTLAIQDPDVAEAVRFIRAKCAAPIQVDDILRHVPISRRSLERRFMKIVGRTPSDEIRRMRLSLATQLLLDTELAIPDVAYRSGFGSPQYLARLFRKHYNQSPMEFRNAARAK
jgi:LacI family transcriptional regulator